MARGIFGTLPDKALCPVCKGTGKNPSSLILGCPECCPHRRAYVHGIGEVLDSGVFPLGIACPDCGKWFGLKEFSGLFDIVRK